MRSYFNKPSWASRGGEAETTEFYRRAGQTYQDIVATNKITRENRENTFERSLHKRRRLSSTSEGGGATENNAERETVTDQTVAETYTQLDSVVVPEGVHLAEDLVDPPVPRRVPRIFTKQTTKTMITLSSSPEQTLRKKFPEPQVSPVAVNDGKANANAARLQDSRSPFETGASRANNFAYNNAVVEILITSKIPDTKPLIVQRKMAQSLKGVRLAWCARQNIPKELHESIVLTWKGRRLFDVTTCRSLNIDVHHVFAELAPFDEYFSNSDDYRICMEAVTEETFIAAHLPSPTVVDLDQTSPAATDPEFAVLHTPSEIILNCPGLDELNIRVPLTTCVSVVAGAFREARGIPPELTVSLAFDGDLLDPQSRLVDCEIADGDLVDVLVKD
ncbi:ubiquitin-2 like Rad60 SUMO-like-domain-containing protein [Aspergillus karnatakaensis]|uniref:small ubiquitin-related modifier domain-containing protein n=1 Tax=Aspergillus karnatakaensis TaxID=1810916 RepID=UPI003CCD7BA2